MLAGNDTLAGGNGDDIILGDTTSIVVPVVAADGEVEQLEVDKEFKIKHFMKDLRHHIKSFNHHHKHHKKQLAVIANDTIFGGENNDLLFGQHGDDVINGGEGDDAIFGGYGKDTVDGGSGENKVKKKGGDKPKKEESKLIKDRAFDSFDPWFEQFIIDLAEAPDNL